MRGLAGIVAVLAVAIVALASPVQAQQWRCTAAATLQKEGATADAKRQYFRALEDPASRDCGTKGLAAIQKAEDEAAATKKDADAELTGGEVVDAIVDWFLGTAWPWLLIAGVLTLGTLVWRFNRDPDRVLVQGSKEQEDFVKLVAAAAKSAGDGGGPNKIMSGAAEQLPEGMTADVASLLRVPGTVPLAALLNLPSRLPRFMPRFIVDASLAGGWAVAELVLKRPSKPKKTARIALALGDLEKEKQSAILALAAAAWLRAALETEGESTPVRPGNAKAEIAHACFRAGANCHARGDVASARACYAAMPKVNAADAPLAWTGAYLNQAMALKVEKRWAEAMKLVDHVDGLPEPPFGARSEDLYGTEELKDIRRRRLYITAILRVDHFYALKSNGLDQADARVAASAAVTKMADELEPNPADSHDIRALRRAMKMVTLCFDIASDQNKLLRHVREILDLGDFAVQAPQPPLTGAAYYDAACAVSMLLKRIQDETPGDQEAVTEHQLEGLRLLRLAVAAHPEARRKRMVANAKTDPMLDPLQAVSEAEFAQALGEEAKPTAPAAGNGTTPTGTVLNFAVQLP